jgi:hypothetical protein
MRRVVKKRDKTRLWTIKTIKTMSMCGVRVTCV